MSQTTLNTTLNKRIWGINYEEIYAGDYLLWRFQIRTPFKKDGKWIIGLGEKFLRMAIANGVNKFIAQIGQREITMFVPNEKELKRKDKRGEFEMRKSLFLGSLPMRIYYFRI